ncbi:hypothetical protein BFN03_09405 [Rhodococcus sp. WMMA185]|uniref:hypothetical protein n=1 Tax=Rhodococcus sp. WMMA185 TaxID=679318 RepID=UPI0008791597|nr:hypothetical protein [Rhodococcus sp. WMMA185]AOW92827.1 hypothetical protein BFN03_09405 [Rhodococcus sp. WMMA185]
MPTSRAGLRHDVRASDGIQTIDIAGTEWPLHKLEALGAALLTFVTVLTVTQTLQTAVLTAAAVAVVVWWGRRLYASPTSDHPGAEPSHGEAARSQ